MRPIIWCTDHAKLIDQTKLPTEEIWLDIYTAEEAALAIKTMQVRGAPAIGITAAYGLALGAMHSTASDAAELKAQLQNWGECLAATRPTAINLFWGIEQMRRCWQARSEVADIRQALVTKALGIAAEDEDMCHRIGQNGLSVVPNNARILTHCNAGALATGDYGTALGVVRAAHEAGKLQFVWVDETRPFLQGARLTAWELMQDHIPCRLICDNMAGHFMQRQQIDMVVVGADRITANGDVANKIGTYTVAVLCKEHGIPFYVAAPYSTIDPQLKDGRDIPIEERPIEELTHIAGKQIAPTGVLAANPAFDVTNSRLITGIITERGVFRPPYAETIAQAIANK